MSSHTGITRPIDNLGRMVIPIEHRNALGLKDGSRVEIKRVGNKLILTQPGEQCTACGGSGVRA